MAVPLECPSCACSNDDDGVVDETTDTTPSASASPTPSPSLGASLSPTPSGTPSPGSSLSSTPSPLSTSGAATPSNTPSNTPTPVAPTPVASASPMPPFPFPIIPSDDILTLVADVSPGEADSSPRLFTHYKGSIFFVAQDAEYGTSWWTFFPPAFAPLRVTSNHWYSIWSPTVFKAEIFFLAGGSNGDRELWAFDSTNARLVGSGDFGENLVVLGDTLFLNNKQSGLSASNGTDIIPLDIPIQYPKLFLEYKDHVILGGYDDNYETKLWAFNGTHVEIVDEVNQQGTTDPERVIIYNDVVYLSARNKSTGFELFKYDGQVFTLAADVIPGPDSSAARPIGVFDNKLFLGGNSQTGGLWSFDGSSVTELVEPTFEMDPLTVFLYGYPFDDKLFFLGYVPRAGYNLFFVDSDTHTTPAMIENPNSRTRGLNPGRSHAFQGNLYFSGTDSLHGMELWKYGMSSGSRVELDLDISPGPVSSYPDLLGVAHDRLFFVARNSSTNYQSLYAYDGDSLTFIEDSVNFDENQPNKIALFNQNLYFVDSNDVKVISSPNTINFVIDGRGLFALNSLLYIFQYRKIYATDGHITWHVIDLPSQWGFESDGVVSGNDVYFSAQLDSGEEFIAIFNGSAVSEVPNFPDMDDVRRFQAFDNRVFFEGRRDGHNELWQTDGLQTISLFPSINGSDTVIRGVIPYKEELLFGLRFEQGDTREIGLYRLERGQSGPPTMLFELYYDSELNFAIHDDVVFFRGGDVQHDTELWKYDGDVPELVMDGRLEKIGLYPVLDLMEYQNRLFFAGMADGKGHELYSLSKF